MRIIGDFIFLILFVILLIAWLIVYVGMHLAGGAIHLILLIALIFLVVHFLRPRRAV